MGVKGYKYSDKYIASINNMEMTKSDNDKIRIIIYIYIFIHINFIRITRFIMNCNAINGHDVCDTRDQYSFVMRAIYRVN